MRLCETEEFQSSALINISPASSLIRLIILSILGKFNFDFILFEWKKVCALTNFLSRNHNHAVPDKIHFKVY